MYIKNNMHVSRVLRIAAMLLLMTLCFTSCTTGGGGSGYPTELKTPSVALSGNSVSWEKNDFADKFEVSVNGQLFYIESSITEWKLDVGQTFKIRAIGDGTKYVDSAWSASVTYNGDVVVTPDPILTYYTVTFKDYNDTILKTESVESGKSATAPQSPVREGYIFSGWDKKFDNVTNDITVNAMYTTVVNCVCAASQTLSPGAQITVPVKILNNTGLCGFEIVVTYDSSVLQPVSVNASALLTSGWFENSIETSEDNSFSVVWSGISDMDDDGELFVITFVVSENASTDTVLELSYNRENTIDENINYVILNCASVNIIK